ncbi:MAG: response regulator, partial [Schwartzia sp.]|nr:response regulator [Schwartzia sp. (in: firmicutes)]
DILDFSKIEAGKIDIIPMEYDLSAVLSDLVNMVHVRADAKGLAVALDFDRNTPKRLCGDEGRIKQVITNILTNAVKYTEKGTVTFSVGFGRLGDDPDSVLLRVAVRDTGIGIKPEDMDKLFSKFQRIEEKRNRNVEGTGLGLTITKNLLELMGASLQVESTYGEGSTFSFALKQRVTGWEPLGDYQASHHEAMRQNRKKYHEKFTAPEAQILVVDDNPMNLKVFQSLLKRTRLKIDTAGDGEEGLILLQGKKYDVIFLDHMMPKKDGIETLHALREQLGGPNLETPAVCLTANAISGAREQYIAAGFDDYLTKPIDAGKLEDVLLAYLPKEKIKAAAEEAAGPAEGTAIPEILAPLSGQDWIDLSQGIRNSGSAEDYLPLLKIFYESLDEKADEIDGYYKAENWKDYTIKVHALKSSARLIGAAAFGEEAQLLENAGKNGSVEFIRTHHEEFLEEYRRFRGPLAEVFAKEETDGEKPEADAELMEGVLEEIRAAAEDMDCERLEAIFAEMDSYRIPAAQSDLYGKLRDAAAQFDYETILSLLSNE